MEQFDKLNETFDVGKKPPISWNVFKFILLLIWTIAAIYWFNDGIEYICNNGLKPSIIRLWEGPK